MNLSRSDPELHNLMRHLHSELSYSIRSCLMTECFFLPGTGPKGIGLMFIHPHITSPWLNRRSLAEPPLSPCHRVFFVLKLKNCS